MELQQLLHWCIIGRVSKRQAQAERRSPLGCYLEQVVGLSQVQGLGRLSSYDLLSTHSLVKRETLSLCERIKLSDP